jgi:hypothetical protein
MGTSIAMIDLHNGHLAVDSFEHAISLLDARIRAGRGRWVDTGTETREAAPPHSFGAARRAVATDGGRPVDTKVKTATSTANKTG